MEPRASVEGKTAPHDGPDTIVDESEAPERVDLEREVARELGLEGILDAKAPSMGRGRPSKEMQAAQAAHATARMAALEAIAAALRRPPSAARRRAARAS